ncbi:hypothetical protein [Deefgea rivuli]|uniref:hypothetical protein n=1 Tax=Deefgea rivuli TaxID=400948 RepID=UPI000489102B|nr:hypothetical protein [Deefgea rivuli]
MQRSKMWLHVISAAALLAMTSVSFAHSTVSYGRITAVNAATEGNANAQVAGALVGGTVGLASGSGRSSSNRALRAVGGGFAGQQLTRMATNSQVFEYTILMNNNRTITMVIDQAGKRVGDCVSVEQGAFNNLRLAADSRCTGRAQATVPRNDARNADACDEAKQGLLTATTDAAFDQAERRVRLLCGN